MKTSRSHLLGLTLGVSLAGCGGSSDATTAPDYPYDANHTVIIGSDMDGSVETPDGDRCLEIDRTCATPQTQCGDNGTADVILGADGEVVDVICYPTSGAPIETIPAEAVPVEKTQNGSVVVLDGAADGADIDGDLSVDANNVVIYGKNPDVSVIGGDLSITKNNATVRGVRITGDVRVEFNNANFVFCVIEGDLTIIGNNTTVAGCEVWGNISISGENSVLVKNQLASEGPLEAQGLVCNDNRHFVDDDADGSVDNDELAEVVECSDKSG